MAFPGKCKNLASALDERLNDVCINLPSPSRLHHS